ncbi:hypothetical protein [Halopiger goleimassiliensis]|uniref:hypothetical protein n=1 Tax=Halopiger goleimassiliensis TaxID=1293048 RepID=UPI000677C90D|nr:hypothetical protein [Halopiger goleimassiliensis]
MAWRCENCGAEHERDDPPCRSCGHDSFVPTNGDGKVASPESLVWACPDCGREHVKNNPPCSRCGNARLEQREPSFEDVDELTPSASYLTAIKPYVPIILLFVVVIGLTATGIVSTSMIPGLGPPSPPDAPGEGDTVTELHLDPTADVESATEVDLDAVGREVHERLEAERERRGDPSKRYDSELESLATFLNRDDVRAASGRDPVGEPDPGEYDLPCSRSVRAYSTGVVNPRGIAAYQNGSDAAEMIASALEFDPSGERAVYSAHDYEAIDVHVYENELFVLYATC